MKSQVERNIIFNEALQLTAAGQIESAFEKFMNKEFVDIAYFEPNYLKEFYTGK
jgi:hypothetical protein